MVAYCFSVTSKQRIEPSCGRFAHSFIVVFLQRITAFDNTAVYRKVGAFGIHSFNRNWRKLIGGFALCRCGTGRSKKTIILINLASLILVFFQWQDFRQFLVVWRFLLVMLA